MFKRISTKLVCGLAVVAGAVGCAAKPPQPAPPNSVLNQAEGPLSCSPVACLPLAQEVEAQCKGSASVRIGQLGAFTVLRVETDPRSFVFTSFSSFYDASGRLVGRSTFVNEYQRHSREGFVPEGAPATMSDACPAR